MRWFSDARKTYNTAVDYVLKNDLYRPGVNVSTVEKTLQSLFVTHASVSNAPLCHAKVLRTPKVIRQQAIKSLISHIKTYHTKHKKRVDLRTKYPSAYSFKTDVRFNPKFKAKKGWTHDSLRNEKCSLRVNKDDPYKFSLYRGTRPAVKLGRMKVVRDKVKGRKDPEAYGPLTDSFIFRDIKACEPLKESDCNADFQVHYAFGVFYLILPKRTLVKPKVSNEQLAEREDVVALDPGARKFLTGYSPQGTALKIGTNTYKVIDKCIRRIDRAKQIRDKVKQRLASRLPGRWSPSQLKAKLRKAMRKYYAAEAKARNVVKNLHYQVAHMLLRKFKTVILPRFSAKQCVANKKVGGLARVTKRRLMMLAFGKFGPRLVQTATFYPDSKVLRGSEAYTSKTCGKCGHLHSKLGASETFKCPKCLENGDKWSADRDLHAARNILLRFLN
jgi:transposase